MTPIRNRTASSQWDPSTNAMIKKMIPRVIPIALIIWIKCSISFPMGVLPKAKLPVRLAILPITVWSPILMTTALQVPVHEILKIKWLYEKPSTAFVEKKATFAVSKRLLLVQSGFRDWGSDSPVRAELSTLNIKPTLNFTKPTLLYKSYFKTARLYHSHVGRNSIPEFNFNDIPDNQGFSCRVNHNATATDVCFLHGKYILQIT